MPTINFSKISNHSFIGSLLRYPLTVLPKSLVVPILQGRLRGTKWIVGAGTHGAWLGSYEFDKQKVFEKLINEDDIIFDLGAHAGLYTLLASKIVGNKGKVFAFEPNPENIFYLKQHLLLNQISNVTVLEVAVSDTNQMLRLAGSGYIGKVSSDGEHSVKGISLDDLVYSGKIPVPNLLKIDIEGSEYLALCGARKILERHHPAIILSTHSPPVHQNCCDILHSFNYSLTPIDRENLNEATELVALASRNT